MNLKNLVQNREGSNCCGGFYHCEKRAYDHEKKDCQECLDDYNQSMSEPIDEDELAWAMSEFGPNAYKIN